MEKAIKYTFLLLLIIEPVIKVEAQTGGVEDETIIVVKPYQATLSDAFKISETPVRDTSKAVIPELKYSINSSKAPTDYTVPEIKPVRIKDEAIPKLYRSYIKGGVGNYATRYGEFFFNSLRSKNFTLGAHLRHISSQGKIKDVGSPFYSRNNVKAYGERFFNNSTLNGQLSFDRDVVNYYGFNINLIEDTSLTINQKQRFDYFDISAGYKNNILKKDRFDYEAAIKYYTMKDKYEHKENNFSLNLGGGTNIQQFYTGLEADFLFTNYSDIFYNYKNNIFTILPYASTRVEGLDIKAGLKITGVSQGHGSKFKFFPEIKADFKLVDTYLIVFAKVDGGIEQNNFRKLTEINPFFLPNLVSGSESLLSSSATNSEIAINFTGGLKGTFSNSTSYHAWVNYKSVNAMPFFVNNYDDILANTFILIYDDVNILNLHGEIGFHTTEKIRLIAKGDFYKYTMTAEEHPWHKPLTEFTLTTSYNLADKFLLKSDFFYVAKRYAKNAFDLSLMEADPIELKGYLDLNLGIDYRYTKILSFFVNFNNIGAAKYQYWNNYPAQRFNVLGGITFAF